MSHPGSAVVIGALVAICAGCGQQTIASQDPCTLLAAREAEPYVGTLATPPYRASDGAADAQGDQCLYRGRDGRELAIEPDWTGGGATAGDAVQGAENLVGSAAGRAGAGNLDTMAHRVIKTETAAGPWDRATWIPGGSLFVSKGDRSAVVDVTGASGQESDALAVARVVMPRFADPLQYDGSKAVALVPKPPPHPAAACDLVPQREVEAAIGPLDGTPGADDPATTCTYRVRTDKGEATYPVEFVWQGGQKNFMMLKHSMAAVAGMIGAPSSSPLDTMTPSPAMQQAIGGAMKMLGNAGAGGSATAPGAASTIGFKTDTALPGPWDSAALLHGTQLIAVRHDVSVGMTLQSADYHKARALLAAIMAHL